jgi:hypothetical protein
MTNAVINADGTNVTNQIQVVSDLKRQGDLNLSGGKHSVTATADVDCWYCSNRVWHASSQVNFCVAAETWPSNAPTFTAFAKGDSLTWKKTSDTTVGVAADAGTAMTRWNLVRVGGIGSHSGIINSTENTCLCMQSMDAHQDTPIGLAICDGANPLQQWEAFLMPNTNNHYRLQNNGRSISDACLTEDSNGVLTQKACQDTDKQLWRVRNNVTQQLVSPF